MNNKSQILSVPIEDIIPNRFQPRLSFDDSSLQELANSIKEHGIIQPLVLRKLGEKYEIIAGERRYKAAKIAGLTQVPAIITEMNDQQSAEVAIVENIQRKDLNAIEEAKSYRALLDKGFLTQEELAKKMGVSQSAISNKLRLLSLADAVQNALMEGKISERHARSLLQIEDSEKQVEWLNRIITERLTVKDLEKKIKNQKKEEAPLIKINPNIEEIINNATDILDQKEEVKIETPEVPAPPEKLPNKFFNALEDEAVNMMNSTPDDEVELLDFDVPLTNEFDNEINKITELINELRNNGLNIFYTQTKGTDNVEIIINIKKDE